MVDIRQRAHADAPASPEHIIRSAAQGSRLHECLAELSENYRMVQSIPSGVPPASPMHHDLMSVSPLGVFYSSH
jgi:hypothetical protein